MKIHSIRYGPATNSSSSHSLIFLPEGKKAIDDCDSSGEFGWEFFTASTKQSKMCYLAVVLKSALSRTLPGWASDAICRCITGKAPPKAGYIDHDSMFGLPKEFQYDVPCREFLMEFKNFLLQDRVAILGGNDNESWTHPLAQEHGGMFQVPWKNLYGDIVCRKDDGGFWTIFDRHTSNKVRVSFEMPGFNVQCDKASAPELVDIKITDMCPHGCPYCYQDSGPNGAHAKEDLLFNMVDALSLLNVFELAIGGGEPTLHPEFDRLLRYCRHKGIVANFSTRSLDWIRNDARRGTIIENCGAFAVSIDNAEEMKDLSALARTCDIPSGKIGLHVIVDNLYETQLKDILENAHSNGFRVTLLGYKDKGRGLTFSPASKEARQGWWIDLIKRMRDKSIYVDIGVDTALARRHEEYLRKSGVPGIMYETNEGKFSCYMDAVKGRIGPSSFCDDSDMSDLDPKLNLHSLALDIKNKFARY